MTMKFQAGSFLEVDDLAAGRKVVMVCRDGVTFWDCCDADSATPLLIHPSLNPLALGTLAQFCKAKGLQVALRKITAFLQGQHEAQLYGDPLFVMRVLWWVAQKGGGDGFEPDEALLACACSQAQQQTASRLHGYAKKFCTA